MEEEKLLDYIELLREKAEKDKLVIFVGAGVSCNTKGMPSWSELIQKMAKTLGYSKCSNCKHKKENCTDNCLFIEDYSSDEFLKIPQYLYNKNQEQYRQMILENINGGQEIDAPLSSAIFDINPVHIITTNYDHLLETSKNEFCEQYQVIIHDGDLLNTEKSKYIIKMHGDLGDPDTIVLKEDDYLNYSQEHILIELFLKSLLTDHIILFLGYSLNDYNIKLIISWLNYMRSQNHFFDDRKVGYIVLDEEEINDDQVAYFSNNNIGVINIHKIPLMANIPKTLDQERGKRLYSFLRMIADPALEEWVTPIKRSVEWLSKHTFIEYRTLLKFLYIKQYEKTDTVLRLFDDKDYERVVCIMKAENELAHKLKDLFLSVGIERLWISNGTPKKFMIGELSDNHLFSDKLYKLYVENRYDELASLLEDNNINGMKRCFYGSILFSYRKIRPIFGGIDFEDLDMDSKVAYLNNLAIMKYTESYTFDSSRVKNFIMNKASKEREVYAPYLALYNGNDKKIRDMNEELEELKVTVKRKKIHFSSLSYPEIFKIKNEVINQYLFVYSNGIFYSGFNDMQKFLKPYIEAIICTNCEQAKEPSYAFASIFERNKYELDCIDIDIITKFISSRNLADLLKKYKVIRLNISNMISDFMVKIFQNLCQSIVKAKTYGQDDSVFEVLGNLIQLLNLTELNAKQKEDLAISIRYLFNDIEFDSRFFSVLNSDLRYYIKTFADLCNTLPFSGDIEIFKKILGGKTFFEYAINTDFYSLKKLLGIFLKQTDTQNTQNEIENLINLSKGFNEKIILLRLCFGYIKDESLKQEYCSFLLSRFTELNTHAIFDFVFSGWLTPSPQDINQFMEGIVSDYKKQIKGGHQYPDPVEIKLECVYLLYMQDIIDSIDILSELKDGKPHLQFLLNPDNFDYTQVDFSNYMWENFARIPRYMKKFVEHSDEISPKITERIKAGTVCESEKKLYYRYFVDEKDFWKI